MSSQKARRQKEDWQFTGFSFPNYTPIPDQVFDELLTVLSGAELKVLLYICRRTFGFKQRSDNISLSQMLKGIVTKEGKRLDHGVGLSKPTLLKSLRSLKEKNIILTERRKSEERGDEPTSYELNIVGSSFKNASTTVVKEVYHGGVKKVDQAVVKKSTPQETVIQETVIQQPVSTKNNNNSSSLYRREDVVVALVEMGISKKVSEKLSSQYEPTYIMEKIEYLSFELEGSPERVKSPSGWLRRAIVDDYAKPDGFISQAERDAKRKEEEAQREEEELVREEIAEAQRRKEAEEKQKKADVVTRFEKKYSTTDAERELWARLVDDLKPSLPMSVMSEMKACHLLSTENRIAVLGTSSEFTQQRLGAGKLHARLKREMGKRTDTEALEVIILSPDDD